MDEPQPNHEPAKARKIIDHAQLHQITEKLFCKLPVHLVSNNQKNQVRVLGYSHPHFEVGHSLPPDHSRSLLLIKDDNSMLLECSVVERTANNTEILKPMRLFVSKRGVRGEDRVEIPGSRGLTGVVQNVLPQTEFFKQNASSDAKRDAIVTKYTTAMREFIATSRARIELQKHNRLSVRMKKLLDFNLPIFAPLMTVERQGDDLALMAMPYSEYGQVMRADDLPGDFIGEICEPIRYGGVFIIGYAQVLSTTGALNISQYHAIRQLTRRLENELGAAQCFPNNPQTGKIVDISNSGMGFMYALRRNPMSGAEVGDKIVLSANFTADLKSVFAGRIMNMSPQENAMRFGIEFENLSESNETAIKTMLDAQAK